MNRFEGWVLRAIDGLEDEFLGRDGRDENRREYVERLGTELQQVGFPGIVALLAARGATVPEEELGDSLIRMAAAAVAADSDEVREDETEAFLRDVLVKGRSLDGAFLHSEEFKDEVMAVAIEAIAAKAGFPSDDESIEEAVHLLETGEFFGDIATSTAAVAFVFRRLPVDLARDLTRLQVVRLVLAASIDLLEGPFDAAAVVRDILDNQRLDNPPAVLDRTFAALYGMGTATTIAETIQRLIGPDNKTVRLLILVYARAHGLPATPEQLDAVAALFQNTPRPDLGPALTLAADQLIERYGADGLLSRVSSLAD